MKEFRSVAPPVAVVQKIVDFPACAGDATPALADLKKLMASVTDLQVEVSVRVCRKRSDGISTLLDRLAPRLDERLALTVGVIDSVCSLADRNNDLACRLSVIEDTATWPLS